MEPRDICSFRLSVGDKSRYDVLSRLSFRRFGAVRDEIVEVGDSPFFEVLSPSMTFRAQYYYVLSTRQP